MTPTPDYSKLQIICHEKTHRAVLKIFENFAERGRVLDLPAGEGALSWRLAALGYEVVAGEIDPAFFKVKEIACVYLDMNRKMDLPDNSFDSIACLEGLEHLEDQFTFIRECHRILRPGGKLVLSTPNILNLASRCKYFLSGFYSLVPRPINEFSLLPVFDHIHPVTYYQVRFLLHSNGFRISSVSTDLYRRSCYPFLLLYPLMRWTLLRTMRKETDPRQIEANREIRRVMASAAVCLGRTLIVVAEKQERAAATVVQASQV